MSSATADSFPESVGSCRPPTPPTPSPPPRAPAAPRSAPVRRQLDFADAGAGGDLENLDDDTMRALDDIERAYSEDVAKRRAPLCVCRRDKCAVERDVERGRLMYVCSSQPKCKHVALCEEFDLGPESEPAVRSPPKRSNSCMFNIPGNHVPEPRTPINNINLRGAGTTTPVHVSPQGAGAAAAVKVSPRGAGTTTPVHVIPQGADAAAAVKVSPRGPGTTTPVHVSPQGAGVAAAVKVSPTGARSIDEWPTCKCTAGKCKVLKKKGVEYYVCPIPKGQGACTHEVPVHAHAHAVANELLQTGDGNTRGDRDLKNKLADEEEAYAVQVEGKNANGSVNPMQAEDNEWPFDVVDDDVVPTAQATPHAEVHQGSPSMLRQPIAMLKTPTKSPMPPPCSTRSPMTRRPDDICYRCGEKGHWIRNCPQLRRT